MTEYWRIIRLHVRNIALCISQVLFLWCCYFYNKCWTVKTAHASPVHCVLYVCELNKHEVRFDVESWWRSRADCRRRPFLVHWQTWTPGSTLHALEWAGSRPVQVLPWILWSIRSNRRCWTYHPPAVWIINVSASFHQALTSSTSDWKIVQQLNTK